MQKIIHTVMMNMPMNGVSGAMGIIDITTTTTTMTL
jgi:hypothetical protein